MFSVKFVSSNMQSSKATHRIFKVVDKLGDREKRMPLLRGRGF